MAYPASHKLKVVHITAYNPSVGASPAVAYIRVPFRATVEKVTSVLGGAIATGNASVAVAINGASASFTHTIIQSGSAAGQLDSSLPTAVTPVNEDDVISLTPSGATGAAVPAYFSVVFRMA